MFRLLHALKPIRSISQIRQLSAAETSVPNKSKDEDIDVFQEDHSHLDPFTQEFLKNQIKITDFQKVLLSAGSAIAALIDPRR